MANLITLLRLILVFVICAIALYANPQLQLLNVLLAIIIIALDGLDGIIARVRREESLFGANFDIIADRVTEISLWILLVKFNLASIWIAIIFVMRGILVDSLRTYYSATAGTTPFGIMQTRLGKFLVSSRGMRFFYGFSKAITFSWLLLLIPFPSLWTKIWINNHQTLQLVSYTLIGITVSICLARAVPVLFELFSSEA